jgi:hypothetical protein
MSGKTMVILVNKRVGSMLGQKCGNFYNPMRRHKPFARAGITLATILQTSGKTVPIWYKIGCAKKIFSQTLAQFRNKPIFVISFNVICSLKHL